MAIEMNVPGYHLDVADFIGARLSRDAIWSGNRCNWFGDSIIESRGGIEVRSHRVCGSDLYSGTSGIAVFLARLYAITGERVFRTTAEGAIRQALSQLDSHSKAMRSAFYTGLTGIAFALIELAETCQIEKFIPMALLVLEEVDKDDIQNLAPGVLSGSAGVIAPLLQIFSRERRDFLLQMAIKHGDRLLDAAHRSDTGCTWKLGGNQVGLANGITGISWALLELYQATSEQRFRHAAEDGFRYESTKGFEAGRELSPTISPSLPNIHQPLDVSLTWSDGAAGTGLAKLRAFQILRSHEYSSSAEVDVQTVSRFVRNESVLDSHSMDFSPAHGYAGVAELLIEARQTLQDSNALATAEMIGAWGIDEYRRHNLPWPCGGEGGGESPGMMRGLAGIGYFYLRLYDSAKVPSILLIRPPQ
jgi:lantibiotic modifying enzyme